MYGSWLAFCPEVAGLASALASRLDGPSVTLLPPKHASSAGGRLCAGSVAIYEEAGKRRRAPAGRCNGADCAGELGI